jgi:hypothetical protein
MYFNLQSFKVIAKYVSAIFESKYLFWAVLAINLAFLGFTKFYPSMDGAAHLYNTNILFQILNGNNFLTEYYIINNLPIPNWIGHSMMLTFRSFLPAWMAEKILLLIYVSGMAVSFRYLIRVLNPENSTLSILIFPFIYSFLFHLGFYNFSISFILFFSTLGFWLRTYEKNNIINYFVLFLLITLTYFSNLLIFGFLGLTIGFFIIFNSIEKYYTGENFKSVVKYGLKNIMNLLLVSIPGLFFLMLFFVNVDFFPSNQAYTVKELIKWINDARPFIIYNYPEEEIFTEQYLHVIFILLTLNFIFRRKNNFPINLKSFMKADVMILPVLISAVLLFITPNGSGAGMMSDRYCLMLYIFGLTFVVSQSVKSSLNTFIIAFILFVHFSLLIKHQTIIKRLDNRAVVINETSKYIEKNSIVLPVNLSDNWIEPHFSNYLGIDKPMVILENYEASVGWFPIKWNHTRLPNIVFNDTNSLSNIKWPGNSSSNTKKNIDYVLIYGNMNKLNEANWVDLKNEVNLSYNLIYQSNDNYVFLYQRKN